MIYNAIIKLYDSYDRRKFSSLQSLRGERRGGLNSSKIKLSINFFYVAYLLFDDILLGGEGLAHPDFQHDPLITDQDNTLKKNNDTKGILDKIN